jgi:autotransporter-associated beta strand protein
LTLNNGTVSATGSGNGDWGNFYLTGDVSASGTSSLNGDIALRAASVTFGVAGSSTLNVGGVLHNGYQFTGTIIKSGTGTMVLSAANTYTGSTTVSNGTLLVNGSLASGATINGGTLAGSGTLGGAVTVNAGGTLAAGAALNGIGTLTLGGNLTLNGNVLVNLNKGLAQSNSLFNVSGVLTNANGAATMLMVSNLGPALVVGDKFTVFSKALASGDSVTIVPPTGFALINNLAVDGSISVAPPASPVLGYTKSGNSLTFTWSGSATLQVQTNVLSKGLRTNWVDYSTTSGVSLPISTTNGSVFFRLKQ